MVVFTLKDLTQQSFNIDVELTLSVKEFKQKIEKEKGPDYPADCQKLIYAGKILQDDTILESYNLDPKKFLVIMVTKPKPPPVATGPSDPTDIADEPTTSSETSTTSASAVTTTSNTTSTTTSTPSETTAAATRSDAAESLVVMGEEFSRMVENIIEMGYEKPEVERALRASYNNPYTAVQYLVDGIPPNLDFSQSARDTSQSTPAESESNEEQEQSETEDQLEFLRNQPQFNQMRQLIRSNPQLLDAFIQQIGQTNPELLSIIRQNQDAFVRMLNESTAASGDSSNLSGSGTAPASGGGTPSSGTPRSGGQNTILVSPQDRDAIDRLKLLGNFPEDVVIQAYFACEKNENLAAEFLFSQTWDE